MPQETVAKLRAAIGVPPGDLEASAPIVTRPGCRLDLGRVMVDCEDGVRRVIDELVPTDFPLGYHDLRTGAGGTRRLIVSPGRCWLPEHWRAWGWAVQLYAARSRRSWGIGDLADLRALRAWSKRLGAGFLLINPLHAVAPTLPQEASPYLPASRRFRNPIYLCVEEVPGADRAHLAVDGHVVSTDPKATIDRDTVWRRKRQALWSIFQAAPPGGAFDTWRAGQPASLESFVTWCCICELHGPKWQDWPGDLHHPHGAPVAALRAEHSDRVRFFAWLQWLLELQLRGASGDLKLIQDLPIGVDGGGADAWEWQQMMATEVSVGAPADIFNAQGQRWGSPPLVPWRLRAADYVPFIESVRATMAAGGGVRIDHVLGLFRQWWIPDGSPPRDGAYVRYPAEDLLDIVALESHRATSLVVGEDLGTVEVGVRAALAERAILSYRLLWFEDDDPADWPAMAMSAVTTHDLPTVAGLWSGEDLRDQARHVFVPYEALARDRERLLARLTHGLDGTASPHIQPEAVIESAHRALARSPSILLSATLEDAVGEELRPNMPGTTTRPNWSIPLPVPLEEVPSHPTVNMVAAILDEAVHRAGSSE